MEGGFQFFGPDAAEPFGCGEAALGVHAHVERAEGFETETAGGIIELHGGAAEVCEDEIDLGVAGALQGFSEASIVAADGLKGFGTVAEGAKAGFSFGELDRVDIEAHEFSARVNFLEDGDGVAAVAQGAIDSNVAGLELKRGEAFANHDGNVETSGSFSRGDDFGDGFGVELWAVFFVFIFEAAGVFAGVSFAARGARAGVFLVTHSSLVFRLLPQAIFTGLAKWCRMSFWSSAISTLGFYPGGSAVAPPFF